MTAHQALHPKHSASCAPMRCQIASYLGRQARRTIGRPALPASTPEARDDR